MWVFPLRKIFSLKVLISFFLLLPISNSPIYSQDVSNMIKEAVRLENLPDEKAALEKFKEVFKLQPDNIFALNKCSELCSRIGKRETSEKMRSIYFQNARNYAAAALRIQPENAEANCVMAIALGSIALSAGSREKVNAAKEIKKYVDLSLHADSSNYKAWHVLGRWHFELSNLNVFERAAVKVLFGGLPNSTVTESIQAFEKAGKIKNFASNYFELAKAYKKNDQKDKAIACIHTLLSLPNLTEDDEGLKKMGRILLTRWQ
jgi:tetratricopeptide (TPR) repeat protein